MIDALRLYQATQVERAAQIVGECEIELKSTENEIDRSRVLSDCINTFVREYLEYLVHIDSQRETGSILELRNLRVEIGALVDEFRPTAFQKLEEAIPDIENLQRSGKNIYEVSGAISLSYANKITRTVSTTLGLLWERIANISPFALNPEIEFGLKLAGIDLIILNCQTEILEYIQLKTQKNTLTGSQKGRSIAELSVHDNPVFAACFTTNSSWTFNCPTIPRVSGDEFWDRIGMPYSVVLEQTKSLIREIDQRYVACVSGLGQQSPLKL